MLGSKYEIRTAPCCLSNSNRHYDFSAQTRKRVESIVYALFSTQTFLEPIASVGCAEIGQHTHTLAHVSISVGMCTSMWYFRYTMQMFVWNKRFYLPMRYARRFSESRRIKHKSSIRDQEIIFCFQYFHLA